MTIPVKTQQTFTKVLTDKKRNERITKPAKFAEEMNLKPHVLKKLQGLKRKPV